MADPMKLAADTALKSPDKPRPAYNLACEYAKRGDAEAAVTWLRKTVSMEGFDRWDLIRYDADLRPIRHSKAFREFYMNVVPP